MNTDISRNDITAAKAALPELLTAKDIRARYGIGMSDCYALFRRKDFPSFRLGKNTLSA